MYKTKILIVLLTVSITLIGFNYYSLYTENIQLQQEYEWALEMSKLGLEERDKVISNIFTNTDKSI